MEQIKKFTITEIVKEVKSCKQSGLNFMQAKVFVTDFYYIKESDIKAIIELVYNVTF